MSTDPGSAVARSRTTTLAAHEQFEFDYRQAMVFAAGGMFPDARKAEQAMTKIVLGRQLGLTPMQAMTGIHMVEGKPELGATLVASFVRRRPETRYVVVQLTDSACELHFFGEGPHGQEGTVRHAEDCPGGDHCACNPSTQREGEEFLGVSRFTQADAEQAGLIRTTSSGKEMNHTKYPRNMKFARAMTNGVKWYCPEVTGGIPVYAEGEIERHGLVDGAAFDGSAPEPRPVSVSELAAHIPEHLRDRFYAAYGEAAHLRPGQVTPAAVSMSVGGQSDEEVERYIAEMEADNERARERTAEPEPVDAVVVEEHPHDDDLTQQERRNLVDLERQLSDLYDRREAHQEHLRDGDGTSVDGMQLDYEIAAVEQAIVAAGGRLP